MASNAGAGQEADKDRSFLISGANIPLEKLTYIQLNIWNF